MIDSITQEVMEAVVENEAFQVMLATALAEEFKFMQADAESWLKAAKGVCSKIVDHGAYSSDAPTARAPRPGSVPERDPGHGSEPS